LFHSFYTVIVALSTVLVYTNPPFGRVIKVLASAHAAKEHQPRVAMARTKQATPLRREPSSEYASKLDRTPRSREVSATHETAEKPNGKANGMVSPGGIAPVAKKDPGIVTLIIDVAGIYASL
jgi:hypothetical protein